MKHPIVTNRETFGTWLRGQIEARRAGPLAYLARTVEMDQTALSNALAGRRQLRGAYYLKIAKLIGLSPQETEHGMALWRETRRPPGRVGAASKRAILDLIASGLEALVGEADRDERMLIVAELRKHIGKL